MKFISTIFSVIIIITGITFKIMRLQRITNGDGPVTSFEMGQEWGEAAARGDYSSDYSSDYSGGGSAPNGVQSNPYFD